MATHRVAPSDRRTRAKLLIGAGWGLLFGALYALLFFVVGAAIESGAQGAGEAIFVGTLAALVFGAPVGTGLALVAMGILLLALERRRPADASRRWWVGVSIGAAVALLIPLVLVARELSAAPDGMGWSNLLRYYVAWYGLASLLFTLGCGWVAVRFFAPSPSITRAA